MELDTVGLHKLNSWTFKKIGQFPDEFVKNRRLTNSLCILPDVGMEGVRVREEFLFIINR